MRVFITLQLILNFMNGIVSQVACGTEFDTFVLEQGFDANKHACALADEGKNYHHYLWFYTRLFI